MTMTVNSYETTKNTISLYNENNKAVNAETLKTLCKSLLLTPAKSKSGMIEQLQSICNEFEELQKNTETPAVYSKSDIRNASYRTLVKIARELNIETPATVSMKELTNLIIDSGKLKTSGNTRNGNGINATRRNTRETFITAFKASVDTLNDCEYTETHNGNRIAVKIADKVRFTLFVKNKNFDILTRAETIADLVEFYDFADNTKYLSYGKLCRNIADNNYPVPAVNPVTDGAEIASPDILIYLFELFGVEFPAFIPVVETTATETPENTEVENTEVGNTEVNEK